MVDESDMLLISIDGKRKMRGPKMGPIKVYVCSAFNTS